MNEREVKMRARGEWPVDKVAVYVRYFGERITVWTVGERMEVVFVAGRDNVEKVVKDCAATLEELEAKRAVAVLTSIGRGTHIWLFGGENSRA